jgi:limonene-1,2-epoxide hydrolase
VRTRAITAAALSALALAACGGADDEGDVPGGADPDAVEVIREWADELRAGDVDAAAERFEIPSTVQNGTPPIQLTDRADVVAFNESLPCGAELTEAERSGEYTIATFELTERPGPGECGSGVGETAKTAFVIHNGRIVEWRRVVDQPPTEPPSTGPVI